MIRTEIVRRPDREVTRVTFELPASMWAESVHVVGDFNAWSPSASPMGRGRDEAWRLTMDLEQPGAYRCAYLVDDTQWQTDASVDWAPGGPSGDCMVVRARHHVQPTAHRPLRRPARRLPAAGSPVPTLVLAADASQA